MEIKDLVKKAHENAETHGFWDDIANNKWHDKTYLNNAIGNRLMLIVSEAAEAQDGLRRDDIDNFEEELADIMIRTCDLAGGLGIDLESEIIKKMKKNKHRPYKHGKQF